MLGRLPGLVPVPIAEWLAVDERFDEQMAYRDALLTGRQGAVFELQERAIAASEELLEMLWLECVRRRGYEHKRDSLKRPDGVVIDRYSTPALITAARLVQEDLLLLQETPAGHELIGGVLCFPSSWTLGQKIGRPLLAVHGPVEGYTTGLSDRIERILRHLRPDVALMRGNTLIYTDPDLHQPRLEYASKPIVAGVPRYVRVERQTFRRLPETRCIVFAIHTYQVPAATLFGDDLQKLAVVRPEVVVENG